MQTFITFYHYNRETGLWDSIMRSTASVYALTTIRAPHLWDCWLYVGHTGALP